MYIRMVKKTVKKKEYIVHRLVESYKTKEGKPRQRVIMNLGTLDLPKNRWKELATLLEQRIQGIITLQSFTPELDGMADDLYATYTFAKSKPQAIKESLNNRDLVTVDLNSIQTSESRTLGAELVAHHQWEELGFDAILDQCHMSDNEKSVAKALVIGRLLHPASELETIRWFQNQSALVELTQTDISQIGKDIFYETADLLYENKDQLELHLYNKETTLFSLERKCYLFDLTNTYLEGSATQNPLAAFGKSKEKRYDCPLISLALMVDENGFPVFSRVYEGNTSEPKTLQEVIAEMKARSECFIDMKKPIFIMDRGIATADNIKFLQDEGYSYLVIERAPRANDYEEEYRLLKNQLDKDPQEENIQALGWHKISDKTDVYVKNQSRDGLTHVLALSLSKEAKEMSMNQLKEKRFLEDAEKLKHSVEAGNIAQAHKISVRIGRLQEKYAGIASCYEMTVVQDENNPKKATSITIVALPKQEIRPIMAGCYVIITNQAHLGAEEIWKTYMTLTRVESAFRDLKSELGMRPVFHQKETRTKSHLFIGILAYHLLVSIETKLRSADDHREWKTIKSILSTHQRMTVTLVGENNEIYSIRLSAKPELPHQDIYSLLNVTDPLRKLNSSIHAQGVRR